MAACGWGMAVDGPPAVIAGHGALGADVAATAAVFQPESVAGLAFVDGGWEDLGSATGMSATEYVAAVAEPPEVLASMDAFLKDRRDFDPATWDADQERAARAQVDQKHAGHVAFVARAMVVKAVADALFTYRPEEVLGPGCRAAARGRGRIRQRRRRDGARTAAGAGRPGSGACRGRGRRHRRGSPRSRGAATT